MSFNTNTGRVEYIASAGQTLFPFVFKIFNNIDIKVYKTLANVVPNETNDLLILDIDYTVTIDGDAGGSITLLSAASVNDAITLLRDLSTTREIEYQTSGDLLAETLNDDQEYQTYLLADNKQISDRTLIFEENLQGMDNKLPTPEALKILRWRADEKALENASIVDDGVFVNVFNVSTMEDILTTSYTAYSTVNIRGYHSENDGGGGLFNWNSSMNKANANGGTIIDPSVSLVNQGSGIGSGCWIRQYDGDINIKWFGAKGDGIVDDYQAIQSALDTGYNVYLPEGKYRISAELLIITANQKLFGDGAGMLKGKTNLGAKTTIFCNTTIAPYVITRRNPRETSGDTNDVAKSTMVNIENENVRISGIFFELFCDYTDMSPSNLGANVDIAVFNGCRGGTELEDIVCLGYFRIGAIFCDVTRGTDIPELEHPTRGAYPKTGTNGSDQILLSRISTSGGLKGVQLLGAIQTASGDYYSEEDDTIYPDSRGGSGASDFTINNRSVLEAREHHSGYRAYDPTLDPDTDSLVGLSCCLLVDSQRGSATQARTRRIYIENVRMKTIEAARMFFSRAYEVYGNWIHTEPSSQTTYDTGGVLIDNTDYVNHSYGPVACRTTLGLTGDPAITDGADQLAFFGLWGTGLINNWSKDRVNKLTHTREYVDEGSWIPEFQFVDAPTYVNQIGTWTKINDVIFMDFTIEYSGLDIADVSDIAITGFPYTISFSTSVNGQLSFEKSTGWVAGSGEGVMFDNQGISRINLTRIDGAPYDYNDGQLQASGILTGSCWFRD